MATRTKKSAVKQAVRTAVKETKSQVKQLRSEEVILKLVSKNQDTLLRKGSGGRNGRLLRFVPMSELELNRNIVVKSIKGIQPPSPKAPIEHLTIAGCHCIELMHLLFNKKEVKVLPGKDQRNVKEGSGSGRRYYDLTIVPVKK